MMMMLASRWARAGIPGSGASAGPTAAATAATVMAATTTPAAGLHVRSQCRDSSVDCVLVAALQRLNEGCDVSGDVGALAPV
jgi:hypothetical protein